jgi:diphthine synthase
MQSFSFIGLGLSDEKGMTLEGLELARFADRVFAEFYTNTMPGVDLKRLESLVGKKIQVLTRTDLEEQDGRELLAAAKAGSVAFLVPGDPMIATTHVSLRLSLAKIGINARVIHAASIMSAISGATGLQSYKFGKSVTVPRDEPLPRSVMDTISDNHGRGLHTLLLLDVNADLGRQLTIGEAVARIIRANPESQDLLTVGVARLGARDEKMKASRMRELLKENFGDPPHSIVVVGRLHFMESEALNLFCSARKEDLRENP